jgi:hypothetical protein
VSRAELVTALGRKLDEARPALERADLYYRGAQPLAFLAPELRAAIGDRLRPVSVGFGRLIVGSLEERLDVEGFRLGADSPTEPDLWRIWQDSDLDEWSQLAHEEALALGRSFLLVWADEAGAPRITVESARQVYVQHAPGSRRRVAALKRWQEDGRGHAVVFTPREVVRLRTATELPVDTVTLDVPAGLWETVEVLPNALGVVPVVPLVNRRRLLSPDGASELVEVMGLIDALSKVVTDMLVSSEYAAMPRRYVTGIDLPTDEAGAVVEDESMSHVAGRTWMLESPDAKVGQFPEASLDGYTNAVAMLTQQIGALSGLPPHYLGLHGDQPASADAIRSAEASLVARARRRMRAFGGAWEEAMRLAVQVRDGRPDPRLSRLETVWRDPETRTTAQAADAAAKLRGIGLPLGQLLEDLGYTPAQQERIRSLRRAEALDGVLVDPRALTP